MEPNKILLLNGTKYDIIRKIGEGAFGQVCEAISQEAQAVAIKRVVRDASVNYEKVVFEHLALYSNRSDSQFLLKHFKICDVGPHSYFVLELLGRDLRKILDEYQYRNGLPAEKCTEITKCCLKGVRFLKSTGIIHMDIKPENIAFANVEETTIKIFDFGLAAMPHRGVFRAGTLGYIAPEVMCRWDMSSASDIWSLGMTFCELAGGFHPFWTFSKSKESNDNAVIEAYADFIGSPDESLCYELAERHSMFRTLCSDLWTDTYLSHVLWGYCNGKFTNLVSYMLRWDPRIRITPEEALEEFY